jgi:hypothetical protein
MHTMPAILRLAALLLPLATLIAAPLHSYDGRTVEEQIPAEGVRSVQVKQRIGDLTIRGTDGDTLRVTAAVRCAVSEDGDCRHAATKVRVDWSRKGSRLEIEVRGTSRLSARHIRVETTVEMPRTLPLETDTASGDVTISKLESDIEVDIGEGNAELTLQQSVVRRVNLDVGVGDARILLGDGAIDSSGKVLDAVDWSNREGKTIVEVDVGIGDAVVRLE